MHAPPAFTRGLMTIFGPVQALTKTCLTVASSGISAFVAGKLSNWSVTILRGPPEQGFCPDGAGVPGDERAGV